MKNTILIFVIFAFNNSIFSQELIERDHKCSFAGDDADNVVIKREPDDKETMDNIDKILKYSGLAKNFIVKAANVPNVEASLNGEIRYVLYNKAFLKKVKHQTKSDWAKMSILAHEIGHHLQGHTLSSSGSNQDIEVEADKYSGFILQRMGAKLDNAKIAVNIFAKEGASISHPRKKKRIQAITDGWTEAQLLSADAIINLPPNTSQVQNTIPTFGEKTNQKYTFTQKCVFDNDKTLYYITNTTDIVSVKAGVTTIVGMKMPAISNKYMFMYQCQNGTYGVTNDGAIVSIFPNGSTLDIGYLMKP
jgi:uncharacterized protein YbjQ (UPF0145 family)